MLKSIVQTVTSLDLSLKINSLQKKVLRLKEILLSRQSGIRGKPELIQKLLKNIQNEVNNYESFNLLQICEL